MKDLYIIGPANGPYKIGVSDDPSRRIVDIQAGCPTIVKIHAVKPGVGFAEESRLHRELKEFCVTGEWFDCPIELIEKAAGLDQADPPKRKMTADDFNAWLQLSQSRAPFRSERECRHALGMSIKQFEKAKRKGGNLTLALACNAVMYFFEPFTRNGPFY